MYDAYTVTVGSFRGYKWSVACFVQFSFPYSCYMDLYCTVYIYSLNYPIEVGSNEKFRPITERPDQCCHCYFPHSNQSTLITPHHLASGQSNIIQTRLAVKLWADKLPSATPNFRLPLSHVLQKQGTMLYTHENPVKRETTAPWEMGRHFMQHLRCFGLLKGLSHFPKYKL